MATWLAPVLTIIGSLLTYFVGRWVRAQWTKFSQNRKREYDQESLRRANENAVDDAARLDAALRRAANFEEGILRESKLEQERLEAEKMAKNPQDPNLN